MIFGFYMCGYTTRDTTQALEGATTHEGHTSKGIEEERSTHGNALVYGTEPLVSLSHVVYELNQLGNGYTTSMKRVRPSLTTPALRLQ